MRFFVLSLLACVVVCFGCSSSPKKVEPSKKKVSKTTKKDLLSQQYPEFALYYIQNKVSPSVADESILTRKDSKELFRLKKGLNICDGAYLVEIDKIKVKEKDGWLLSYKIMRTFKSSLPALEKGQTNEISVLHPTAVFQMPKQEVENSVFVLLVKNFKEKNEKGRSYHSVWWHLYPSSTEVLKTVQAR